MAAEILERREVLSGATLTLAQAQQDVATAQGTLNTAILGYLNAIVGLEAQLDGDLAQHKSTFDQQSGQAIQGFNNTVDGIIANMDSVLDPIEDQFEIDLEQEDTDLQDEYEDALETLTTDSQIENNSLTNQLTGIENNLDGDIQQADSALTTTDTTQTNTLNGTITFEDNDFDNDVTNENNNYTNTVQNEETNFENDEIGNFTNYETLVGDDTSGFTGNYTNLVNGFETTRDNVLANYPNTVYDPSVLDPLLVQAVIDGAQSNFEDNIAPLIGVYQTNTALIEGDYQDAVQDAWDDFADDMVTATNTRQQRYTDADNDFETTMSGPRSTYADNMADILSIFNDDIAAAVADRTDDYTTAQDDYDTTMTPVIAQYEDDVDAAQQEYEDWENGVGPNNALTSATWRRVKTEDTSTSPPTITWSANGVIYTMASNVTWAGSTSSKEPQPPIGYSLQPGSPTIVVTGSVTTTTEVYVKTSPTAPDGIRANPYEMAIFARFEAYTNQLDGIDEVYTAAVNDAQQDRTAAIDAANAQYLTTVYGNSTGASPYATGSPADVFFSAMNLAQQGFNGTEASEWQDYTDAVFNYYTTLFSQMSANYYMLSPNPAILGGFAQTYLVNALNAAIDYTEAVGAAWVTFVGQERAADSIRDQGLVQAEYDAAVAQENAANTADQGAIGAWASFAGDFLGINGDYTIKRAGKQKDRDQRIADAGQTLLLAHNGAAETKAHKEVLADKDYADKEAVAWDDRWQAEAVEENTLTKAEASAEETRIGDRGVADADFAKDGALAAHTRDTAIIQAEVNRGTDLATEELTLTTGALGFVPQLFTDVATGIDALYTNYFNNDPNQTAVSGAWKQFTTLAGAAWANLRSQEAAVWNSYQTQTVQDWQAMVNQITDAARDAVDNLAPEYITRVNNIAIGLHGYWDAMADALKLRNQTASAAVSNRSQQANTQIRLTSDTIIGHVRTHDDEVTNDTHTSITSVLGTGTQFITDMVTNSLPFKQTLISNVGGIFSNVRSLVNTQSLADLLSLKTVFQLATTTDDAIFPAWANLQTKQSIVSTVTQRDAALNTSVIQFAYSLVSRVYPTFNYAASIFQNDASYSSIRQLLVGQFLANPLLAQAVIQQPQQPAARAKISPDEMPIAHPSRVHFFVQQSPSPPYAVPYVPNPTIDESRVMSFAGNDVAKQAALAEVILALRDYRGPGLSFDLFGEGYCHRWVQGGILNSIQEIQTRHREVITVVKYLTPEYVGPIPIYLDHAVIRVKLCTGHEFFIDKYMCGGTDHISFTLPPDLIRTDDAAMSEEQRLYLELLADQYIWLSGF